MISTEVIFFPPPPHPMASSKPVAFIIGGSRGIGRGAAEKFAKEGYNLSLIARGSDALDDAANVCRSMGAEVVTFAIDVTNNSLLKRAVEQTVDSLGSIDVLLCAAGFAVIAPLDILPMEGTWELNEY